MEIGFWSLKAAPLCVDEALALAAVADPEELEPAVAEGVDVDAAALPEAPRAGSAALGSTVHSPAVDAGQAGRVEEGEVE